MLKSVRGGTVGAGVWGGMSVDADWEVVPGGEACRARVLGESGFGDGEAIGRRWRKGSRRCGEGAVSVTDEMVTSRNIAMTGISISNLCENCLSLNIRKVNGMSYFVKNELLVDIFHIRYRLGM